MAGGHIVRFDVEPFDRRDAAARATSIQPSRQPVMREVLRHRSHHDRLPRGAPTHTHVGLAAVTDAVVDLVGDQQRAVGVAPAGERRQLGRIEDRCRSDWPGSRRSDPAGGPSSASSIATVGWNRVSGPQSSSTTSQPNAASVFRYAGYPGRAIDDGVAGVERGEEDQRERTRRPGGHHDVVGVDAMP